MPCEFCNDVRNVEKYRLALDPVIPLHFCPSCGENLHLVNVIFSMNQAVEELWLDICAKHARKAEENDTVEIDGEILKFERLPSPEKRPSVKPRDMTVDLDKIDISREMELLQEHYSKQLKDHISEHIKQFMKEKKKDAT